MFWTPAGSHGVVSSCAGLSGWALSGSVDSHSCGAEADDRGALPKQPEEDLHPTRLPSPRVGIASLRVCVFLSWMTFELSHSFGLRCLACEWRRTRQVRMPLHPPGRGGALLCTFEANTGRPRSSAGRLPPSSRLFTIVWLDVESVVLHNEPRCFGRGGGSQDEMVAEVAVLRRELEEVHRQQQLTPYVRPPWPPCAEVPQYPLRATKESNGDLGSRTQQVPVVCGQAITRMKAAGESQSARRGGGDTLRSGRVTAARPRER